MRRNLSFNADASYLDTLGRSWMKPVCDALGAVASGTAHG